MSTGTGTKTMWGISEGRILYPQLSHTAEEAMDQHARALKRSWNYLYLQGARVVKVSLSWPIIDGWKSGG